MSESQPSDLQAQLIEQQIKWEASRAANELQWMGEARYGNFLRTLIWTALHGYLHHGVTPQAIMQAEAIEMNRQYDLKHS